MINIDIDLEDLRENWELDAQRIYFGVWGLFSIRPLVRVSSGRGGFHLIVKGVSLHGEQDELFREIWDCPGHAWFTRYRGGADVLFSRRGSKSCLPCSDIFEAIDILKSSEKHRHKKRAKKHFRKRENTE